jgi:nitroreductase
MKPDEAEKLFSKRYSCRSFSDEPVDVKKIGAITKCGLMAPCAMGKHASHLFVFHKGDEAYKKLMEICGGEDGRNPFYSAPVVILETLDKNSVHKTRDGSAVIENMLLAASFMDLAACWIHAPAVVFSENPKLLKKIGIPDDYTVVGSISLGVPSR